MEGFSAEFVPDNREVVRTLVRCRKEVAGYSPLIALAVYLLFLGAITYAFNNLAGRVASPLLSFVIYFVLLLGAFAALRAWGIEYRLHLFNRLKPSSPTRLAVDAQGIHVDDDTSSVLLGWKGVHRALKVKNGILVIYGASGLLIPACAFRGEAELMDFVRLIEARAGGEGRLRS